LDDARLCHLRALGGCKRTRWLWCPAGFLDAEPDRRRNEPPCRRWRCWLRCCGDRCRGLFDRLFDNRWFFDWRHFGNDHDWMCFIDFNRRR
jgi:hypothetical protein